jgi:hypothetical protein
MKKSNLNDPVLRAKLAKGMGHNYYLEPTWPNDLLYIFPVVILGTIACNVDNHHKALFLKIAYTFNDFG